MVRRNLVGGLLRLALTGLLLLQAGSWPVPAAAGPRVDPPLPGSIVGDWIVNGTERYAGGSLVLDGNLSVPPGASLLVIDGEIRFTGPAGARRELAVDGNGTLSLSGTRLSAPASDPFRFISYFGASVTLQEGVLDGTGAVSGAGVRFGSSAVGINGTRFVNGTGVALDADGIRITNAVIERMTGNALVLGSVETWLTNVTVRDSDDGVYGVSTAPHLERLRVENTAGWGMNLSGNGLDIQNSTFQNNSGGGVHIEYAVLGTIARGNRFLGNGGPGLECYNARVAFDGAVAAGNAIGMQVDDAWIGANDSTVVNNTAVDLMVRGGDDTAIVATNTTFTTTGFAPATRGQIVRGWFLDLDVRRQSTDSPAGGALVSVLHAGNTTEVPPVPVPPSGLLEHIVIREETLKEGFTVGYNPQTIHASIPSSGGGLNVSWPLNMTRDMALLLRIDDVAPGVSVLDPAEGLLTNRTPYPVRGVTEPGATVNLGGVIAMASANGSFSLNASLKEGPNALRLFATDTAGNVGEALRNVRLDTSPPLLQVATPVPGTYFREANITVAGSTEAGARVWAEGIELTVDPLGAFLGAITLPADGPAEVRVTAVDPAGNDRWLAIPVTVDRVPPGLTITDPADGVLVSATAIRVAGTVLEAPAVSVNGIVVVPQNGTWSVRIPLLEGSNEIVAEATDFAGNTVRVTVRVTGDTIPPPLAVAPSGPEVLTNMTPLDLEVTSEPGAIVVVDSGGAPVAEGTIGAGGRLVIPLSLREGGQQLRISAVDAAGNRATEERIVVLDTVPPRLTLSQPARLLVNTLRVVFEGGAEGAANVTVNGVGAGGSDERFLATLDFAGDGIWPVTIRAADRAGNAVTLVLQVTVDTKAPSLTIDKTPSRTRSSTLRIVGTTEPGAIVEVNGARATVDAAGRFGLQIALVKGRNEIRIEATDAAGNKAAAAPVVVRDVAVAEPAIGAGALLTVLTFVLGAALILYFASRRPKREAPERRRALRKGRRPFRERVRKNGGAKEDEAE